MNSNKLNIALDAVLETMVDGAIIIDDTGSILSLNPAAVEMFGYTLDEILDRNINRLMPAPYQDEHDGYLRSYNRTGRKKIIGTGREVEGLKKDGTVFPIDLSVGETKADGQKYFIGILRDLTRRQKEKREFEQLQEEHYHMSRAAAMNEMGSAIAHELNQPLAATSNYLETIRMLLNRDAPLDKSKLDDILQKAVEQTQRTSSVVDKLRNHMSSHKLPREALDLSKIIPLAIRIALAPLEKSVEIQQEFPEKAPLIFGNESQLQMVIVQLLRNAIEAVEDEEQPDIILSLQHDTKDKELILTVSDNGSGLNAKNIQNLFVPLSGEATNGSGFGLSICHSIITRHDGRIWAEPNPDGGTIFSFALPVL